MKGPFKLAVPLIAALAAAACSAGGSSNLPIASGGGSPAANYFLPNLSGHAVCPGSRHNQFQCMAIMSNAGAQPNYSGLTAANLEQAYDLPSKTGGKGQNVFIVDAFDNPNVATDLATYRSAMGLPKAKFNKYNQEGKKGDYPGANANWGVEIDLDVEMVSASCPNCTINLVEANSNDNSDLDDAELEAVKLHATIVSNSWTGDGSPESDFDHKGVAYLASAGDNGYAGGYYEPATFDSVLGVGGTSLSQSKNKRGWDEVLWGQSGGGCSATQEPKPSWQHDKDCKYRTGADVSAQASQEVAEYDSYVYGGWIIIGGTSVASPLVAGMVGLAGNSTKIHGGENLWNEFSKLSFKDQEKSTDIYYISQGATGSCNGEYLCTAGTKQFGIYSGPSGWGTPHGVKAL